MTARPRISTQAGVALELAAGPAPEAEGEVAPSALRTVTSGEVLERTPAPPSAARAEIDRRYRRFNPDKLADVPTCPDPPGR
jgi:hypothetical protein